MSERISNLQLISLLLLAAISAIFLRHLKNTRLRHSLGAHPAHNILNPKEPILGLDHILQAVRAAGIGQYLPLTHQRHQAAGTTYLARRLVSPTIHTIDPENLRSMLTTDFDSYKITDTRIAAMEPFFGKGIFVSNGEEWAHSRALIRPSFAVGNMQHLLPMLERHFLALVERIPGDGSTFDLQPLLADFTMDVATEFLFGQSTESLGRGAGKDGGFVDDYTSCCMEAMRRIKMGPLYFLVPGWKSGSDAARRRMWGYIDGFVRVALEESHRGEKIEQDSRQGYNLLRELARDSDDPVELRSQILNILVAGRDTTASLLSNFFHATIRSPETYGKLRDEVLQHVGSDIPTEAVIKNMTYLRWCLNETMRLYPPVAANTRQAIVDTTLPLGGGPEGKDPILVPKGSMVVFSAFAMHRRPDIFGSDVEVFRPERWDGLRPGWGFLPFHGGPRICLGQQFALTEASYVIVRMMQTFESMKTRDERPWSELYSLGLFSRHGVGMAVTPSVA